VAKTHRIVAKNILFYQKNLMISSGFFMFIYTMQKHIVFFSH